MDNRPIGVFDSGVGGLTSIPYMRQLMPDESIIYYGDIARAPYGNREPELILRFCEEIAGFLAGQGVKMIAIACNTATVVSLAALRAAYPQLPVTGCVLPTAAAVAAASGGRDSVGIMATRATVRSGAYVREIRALAPDVKVSQQACPVLVPLIEEGIVDDPLMDMALRHYLDGFIADNGLNKLVLGCTHYPMIAPNLRRLYPDIRLYNSSYELARAVKTELDRLDMRAAADREPELVFYASSLSEAFMDFAERAAGEKRGDPDIRLKTFGE